MKKMPLLLIVIGISQLSFAQGKHDYNWILGSKIDNPETKNGGTKVDFKTDNISAEWIDIGFTLSLTMSTISDNYGNLQFYSNGCEIMNKNHVQMAGGDSINFPSKQFEENCSRAVDYGTRSGILSLPMPGTDDNYIMFHLRYDSSTTPYPFYFFNPQSLLYTTVDMTANNGLGRVIQKNMLVEKDTFCDMLTAVRHGNGHDWWLVAPKPGSGDKGSDKILLYLLTNEGIKGPFVKKTDLEWKGNPNTFAVGQAVFSPDGTRYARIDTKNGIHMYCFDRCSGEFSCPVQLGFPGDTLFAAGISFSPNSRFLYASTGRKMYQFDCSEKDVQKSKTLLGIYDGFKAPLWTTFYQQQLAPDGKIYMSCTNSAYYLHVVHNPDVKGEDSNFEQHGFELPTKNGFTLPNYPNFQLYDWANSPCDTLAVDSLQVTVSYFEKSLKIFPNPSNKMATIVPPDCVWGSLRVYNAAGVLMQEIFNISSGQTYTLETGYWPAGVYFVSVLTRTDGAVTKRLLVRH